MSNSLNKVMLIGRLGDDPKLSYTQSNTAFARMRIATSEKYKDQNGDWVEKTEWHTVKAWGRLAEICQQILRKGTQVYVEGALQTSQYEDKDKIKRESTEVKAIQLLVLDSKPQDAPERGIVPAPNQSRKSESPPVFQVNEGNPDDDLPF